jgi:enterochelin esterase family protein
MNLPFRDLLQVLLVIAEMVWLAGCAGVRHTLPSSQTREAGVYIRRLSVPEGVESTDELVGDLAQWVRRNGRPIVEDSTALIFFRGKASRVSFAGDVNGWNPSADTLYRVPGTDLFFLTLHLNPRARIEYKIVVNSLWIMDPANPLTAEGGFGLNSELQMPEYIPPADIQPRTGVPHGAIDTLQFTSTILGRTHPILVYRPAYEVHSLPLLFVNDGGEYLQLAKMNTILDNCIEEGKIRPLIVAFIDPRTDPRDPKSNHRMDDYTLSHSYLRFLSEEVRPFLLKRYPVSDGPEYTGIMGASLGGLISTFAAFQRPDVFGFCAAQSPSYFWRRDSIFTLLPDRQPRPRFYIDTGTIRDAGEQPARMAETLQQQGYQVRFQRVPESHNWGNWRARIPAILEYFCPHR